MADKSFSNELERALSRSDAATLVRQIDLYIQQDLDGGEWPDEISDDLTAVLMSGCDDADKALAYVMIAAARTDDADFLGFIGAGPLEDSLRQPTPEFLERVVSEARKTPRFRWLLSMPYPHAIAPEAWEAIQDFVIPGASQENLPPRPWV